MTDYTIWQDDPFLLATAGLVEQYAEWTNTDPFEVAGKVETARTLIKEEFHRLGDKFYTESNVYIYDMLAANPTIGVRANLINKFIPGGIRRIQEHPGKSFADFGAGVGAMCELAHELGKDVTHIDLASHSRDFAMWRSETHNLGFKFVEIPEDDFTLPEQYDIIFTDAVWEHLNPDKQIIYLLKLMLFLKPGGMFYFLIDLSGVSPDMPMHYNVNVEELHRQLSETCKMTCEYGKNQFASVWHKQ